MVDEVIENVVQELVYEVLEVVVGDFVDDVVDHFKPTHVVVGKHLPNLDHAGFEYGVEKDEYELVVKLEVGSYFSDEVGHCFLLEVELEMELELEVEEDMVVLLDFVDHSFQPELEGAEGSYELELMVLEDHSFQPDEVAEGSYEDEVEIVHFSQVWVGVADCGVVLQATNLEQAELICGVPPQLLRYVGMAAEF